MNSATQLSLAERDLDHARLAIGAQRDARLDACNARLMPLPADLQPGRQASLLRDLAIEYYLKGDRGAAAMAPIAKACLLLSAENDTAALRRCRSIQCLILTENGDFAGAMHAGVEARQLARALEDPTGEATAWLNLGLSFYLAGLIAECRACGTRALRICEAHPTPAVSVPTLHMLSLCCWLEQDARTALRYSERAAAGADLAPPDAGPQVRSLAEAFAARYSLHLRDLVGAQRHVERALDWAERCGSERARSAAQVSQGLLQVHQGEIDDGLARLRRCVDEARVMQREVLTGAIAALVEAYEHLNDPHNALAILRLLMQVSRGKAMDAATIRHQYGDVAAEASVPRAHVTESLPEQLNALARRMQARLARPDLLS